MVFTQLKKALSRSSQLTGFVHVYATELVEVPKGLLDGLKGLLAIQPFRREDGKLSFIAYWSTSDTAKLAGPALQARLTTLTSTTSGVSSEPLTKISSVWEWVKDKAVPLLLLLVAVIAALEGLANRYAALIAVPQYTLMFDSREYIFDAGETKPVTLTVENALTAVELTDISIAANLTKATSSMPSGAPELSPHADAPLPATKSRPYYMTLKGLTPGEHELNATVTANAGLLASNKEIRAKVKVIVWPSEPEVSVRYLTTQLNRADLRVTLRVGKDAASSGVTCHLIFLGKFTKPEDYFRPLGKAPYTEWVGDEKTTVVKVTWSTLTARSASTADLSLVGDSSTDWQSVVANHKTSCSLI